MNPYIRKAIAYLSIAADTDSEERERGCLLAAKDTIQFLLNTGGRMSEPKQKPERTPENKALDVPENKAMPRKRGRPPKKKASS